MNTTDSRYIEDFATGKRVLLTPEEPVRQEYERILVESYGYCETDMDIEVRIERGTGHDWADIVVYSEEGRDPAKDIVGIVEAKRPERTEGIAQLKSYMSATSAMWGVWTNGIDISYLCRQDRKILEDYIHDIPIKGQSIEDIGRGLTKNSLEPFGRSQLKATFRRILYTLYANANITRRERLGGEMIKIIFSKLQDEKTYPNRPPEFRAETGESPSKVANRVKKLFSDVLKDLKGDDIFKQQDKITLDVSSIRWVVGQLQHRSLLKTDTDYVGDAFEVFSEAQFVGEKGEFFTPRGVVHVAVKLADPNPNETVCDPACGSGGFLVSAMKHIWEKMEKDPKWIGTPDLQNSQRRMAAQSLFGIDKEIDLVRIAKAHMAIAGDGRSNICHQNSLHTASQFNGDASRHFLTENEFEQFDIILTNPPFSTKTKIPAKAAADFELGYTWKLNKLCEWIKGGEPKKRDPYVLFIERCLDMLKVGGTLCIVLPETVFHAPTKEHLRHFLLHGNNLIAVVDLPHNTFRPYCNAKTCLLVLKKGVPQQDRIIMATPREMGHDHNGKPLYQYGTNKLWDDLEEVLGELDTPENKENNHVFSVHLSELDPNILVPRFYRALQNLPDMPDGCVPVSVQQLLDEKIIRVWNGHGSPPGHEKGMGGIPYIRVSDIVNWEMYRNPVTGIPEDIYREKLGKKQTPKEGDVIFVRRGSYRIGTVAMASPRDERVLLTTELLTFRISDKDNGYGITPFYLLVLLSSQVVQDQLDYYVFIDTTLPTIGDRWKKLVLPIHTDKQEIDRISKQIEDVMRHKWAAQEQTDILRNQMGKIVT